MFQAEELRQQVPHLLSEEMPVLERIQFSRDAFQFPHSEEFIEVHKGSKGDFQTSLHFWVKSVQSLKWVGRSEYILLYIQELNAFPSRSASSYRL